MGTKTGALKEGTKHSHVLQCEYVANFLWWFATRTFSPPHQSHKDEDNDDDDGMVFMIMMVESVGDDAIDKINNINDIKRELLQKW